MASSSGTGHDEAEYIVEVHVIVRAESVTHAEDAVARSLKGVAKARGYVNHYVADIRGEADDVYAD